MPPLPIEFAGDDQCEEEAQKLFISEPTDAASKRAKITLTEFSFNFSFTRTFGGQGIVKGFNIKLKFGIFSSFFVCPVLTLTNCLCWL